MMVARGVMETAGGLGGGPAKFRALGALWETIPTVIPDEHVAVPLPVHPSSQVTYTPSPVLPVMEAVPA